MKIPSPRCFGAVASLYIKIPFALAILCIAGMTSTASASSYTWDANTGTAGAQNGSGTWDTSTASWLNSSATDVAWVNTTGTANLIGNTVSGTSTLTLATSITVNTITMSGANTNGYNIDQGSGPSTLTLLGSGAGLGNNNTTMDLTINAVITGVDGLLKFNAGNVNLTQNNTYSGGTTLRGNTSAAGGSLTIGGGGTTGSLGSGDVTFSAATNQTGASALIFDRSDAITISNNMIISGTKGGVIQQIGGNTLTLSGTQNISTSGTYNIADTPQSVDARITGLITGSGTFTKSGAGTLVISNANNYSGGTILSSGTLSIGNGSALGTGNMNVAGTSAINTFGSGAETIANNIFLSGASLVIGGSNNITINGNITGSGNNRTVTTTVLTSSTSTLTVAGNVYLAEDDSHSRTFSFGSSSAGGSPGTAIISGTIANNSGANTDASNFTASGGGTVILSGSSIYTGATTVTNSGTVLQIGNGGTGGNLGSGSVTVTSGVLSFDHSDTLLVSNTISGTGSLKIIGSGTTVLAATNSYSGGTTIASGALEINQNSSLGADTPGATVIGTAASLLLTNDITSAQNMFLDGNTSGNHLVNVSGSNTLTGVLTGTTGGNNYGILSNSGKLTLSTITVTGAVAKGITVAGAGDVTFTGSLGNTVGGSAIMLTKTGAGTLTLSASDTYTGTTLFQGGTLALGNDASLGTGQLNLNYTGTATIESTSSATRTIGNSSFFSGSAMTQAFGGTGDLVFNGAANMGGPFTRFFQVNNTNTTFNAALSGSANLTKTGNGNLILAGANTYTGATTVNAGTLVVSGGLNGTSDNVGNVTVNAGTLAGAGAINLDSGNQLSVGAGATVAPGNLDGSGNSLVGKLTVNDSSLSPNAGGTFSLASGAQVNLKLGGTAAGTQSDQIVVLGNVNLDSDSGVGATLNLTLNYVPTAGDTLFLILNGGTNPVVGTFAGLAEGSTVIATSTVDSQNYAFTISYVASGDSTPGNDVALTAAPEPAPGLLFLAGMTLIFGAARYRRKQSGGRIL